MSRLLRASHLLASRPLPLRALAQPFSTAPASQPAPVLVTFDVDGTLIHAVGEHANRLHKRAFSHAFKVVYGVEASIDEVEHHGSTDLLVTLAVMKHKGVPLSTAVPLLPRVAAEMTAFCVAQAAGISEGLQVLPGVEELLVALAGRRCLTALVTGNLEPIGWAKMAALGLKKHFSTPLVGGFASDYCSNSLNDPAADRAEFIRIATRKAASAMARSLNTSTQLPLRVIHFGDTPNDIRAAAAAGALPVGLATGAFSAAQLRDAARAAGVGKSAVVLEDLRDTAAVLQACGL